MTMRSENTWRIVLDSDQEIKEVKMQQPTMTATMRATKTNGILPTVFGEEGDLFYKLLDPSLFAVITASKTDPTSLTVYVINGVTGRIIHQVKETNVSTEPNHVIGSLFSEQFLALSFMRLNPSTGISQQELAVTELYSKKKEGNTVKLLTDYFKGDQRITSDTYSSFDEEGDPVVISETYVTPFTIKAMALTETASHITGRNMVLVTGENKIFRLPESGFTARRPHPE